MHQLRIPRERNPSSQKKMLKLMKDIEGFIVCLFVFSVCLLFLLFVSIHKQNSFIWPLAFSSKREVKQDGALEMVTVTRVTACDTRREL